MKVNYFWLVLLIVYSSNIFIQSFPL